MARVAAEIAAQADLALHPAAMRRDLAQQPPERRRRLSECRQLRLVPARGIEILDEIVAADREEVGREILQRQGGGRHFDHHAERRPGGGPPLAGELIDRGAEHGPALRQLRRQRDHRDHHLEVAMHRGAGERAQLRAEDLVMAQAQAHAADAEERIGLALAGEAGHRLVAAGIERPDGDRAAARPFEDATIGAILLVLVGQAAAAMEQELGADQPDAVAVPRVDRIEIVRAGDVDHHLDRLAARCYRRPPEIGGGVGAGERVGGATAGELLVRACIGIEQQQPRIGVQQGLAMAFDMRSADADDHRHAAGPGQDRDMAGRAAAQQDEATARPVGRQEARRRQIVGDDDGAGRDRCLGPAGQAVEHALAQIGDVGGAAAEIGILRRGEIGHLRIERRAPGGIRRHAGGDGGEDGIGEGGILQQGQLEFQDAGLVLVGRRGDQPGQPGAVACDRRLQLRALLGRAAGMAQDPLRGRQPDQPPGGEPWRRRRAPQSHHARPGLKPHR